MDIVCKQCQSRFKIADDKIPAGKTAVLTCPKCKNKITVSGPEPEPEPAPAPAPDFNFETGEAYDAADKPFDFIEEEGKTVLICEQDPERRQKAVEAMKLMEFHVTSVENAREALKKMRFHNFDLIVINERFDTQNPDSNGLLIYIERIEMSIRRNMFVVLLTDRYRTSDKMMAFNRSVNVVVNVADMDKLARIVSTSITEHDLFYKVYHESMKKMDLI